MTRLRFVTTVNPSKAKVRHISPDTLVTFAPMEVIADGLGGLDVSISKPLGDVNDASYSYFSEGDLLLAKVTPCFENGKKAIASGLTNGIGFATSEVHVIRPNIQRVDRRYLNYLFCSEEFRSAAMATMSGTGGLRRISDRAVLDYHLPVADLATQKAIADFLDRETARIDQLIEKKQRLQQRLNERRSTYLDQLTFGHEDQANWKRIPFKWICLIPGGQVDPTLDKWAGLPLIAPNHIEPETGRLLAIESARDQGAISGKYLYPANTVLYSKIRPALAKACIAPESGLCSADMYPIVPSRALLPEYLLMQLLSRTFTNWATQESMRVAMPKINRETLGNFRLVVPPIDIQRRMVAQHALERNRTELLVDAVHHSIELLRELRSALVTSAVGGQSDLQAPASNRPASNSVQDRETTGRATL